MFWLKGCSRCGGDLYRGEDIYGKYIACLQCGRHLKAEEEAKLGLVAEKATAPEIRQSGQRKEQEMVPAA